MSIMSQVNSPDKKQSGSRTLVPSIIGIDLNITGDVISKGEVQIDGEIQGDIHCSSLIVGEKAVIAGSIVADEVTVRGKVTGSIRGQRVTLQSTSHVEGDIFHKTLAIEMGAFFEGKSRRSENPMASAPNPEEMIAAKIKNHLVSQKSAGTIMTGTA